MSNQVTELVAPELPPETDVLAYTHHMRVEVLRQMMTGSDGNSKLPEDPADRKTIVTVLKDMDGQALGRMRIKVEQQANNNQEAAASLIAQLLNATAGHSAFKVGKPVARPAPVLPSDIPAPVLVEGETETQAMPLNYEEFVTKMTPPEEKAA